MAKWYIGMTEDAIRQKVADTALALVGIKEGTAEHKKIIDIYNAQHKLPRGYKMTYTDAWCAATMTYIGIVLDIIHIILPECSCSAMIERYKKAGRWEERDDYVPELADIVMYDWDAQKGECTGAPEHTGMVVGYNGKNPLVLEGNYDNQVKIREICVEYIKVRGYCLPDYGSLVQPFNDVPSDHPHAEGIAWGAAQGIVLGVGNGLFEPDRPVTRGELMTILHRRSLQSNG
jgi:hypothetical protein